MPGGGGGPPDAFGLVPAGAGGDGFQPPLYAAGSPNTVGGAAPLMAAIRCRLLLPEERILLGKGPRRCAKSGFSDLLEGASRREEALVPN